MQIMNGFNTNKYSLLKEIQEKRKYLSKYEIMIFDEELKKIETLCNDIAYNVKVTGDFSSGKSSFINSVLEDELLPTSALPMTSVLTEVRYGENGKATLYSLDTDKNTAIMGNSQSLKDYYKYKEQYESPNDNYTASYKKIVVYSDSKALKDGLIITEIPSFPNLPEFIVGMTLEERIKQYFSKNDLIIYCTNALRVFSTMDIAILDELSASGYDNILIVVTFFDSATDDMNPEEKKTFCDIIFREYCSKYTFKKNCFFVDARLGSDKIYDIIESCSMKEIEYKTNFTKNAIYQLNDKINTILSAAMELIDTDDSIFYKAIERTKDLPHEDARLYEQCVEFVKEEKNKYSECLDKRKVDYNELLSFIKR